MVLNVKVLVGAFSVTVKSWRTFVGSSSPAPHYPHYIDSQLTVLPLVRATTKHHNGDAVSHCCHTMFHQDGKIKSNLYLQSFYVLVCRFSPHVFLPSDHLLGDSYHNPGTEHNSFYPRTFSLKTQISRVLD